ncbi:MAG: YbhB/YbcL family Raf kinase inhibitor-like protein [Myxococcota bacterium]
MNDFTVSINDWADGAAIPARFAFGQLDDQGAFALSDNVSPAIRWTNAPAGTRSFAIVVSDPDVPSSAEDVNQEGRAVPADLPRITFFHWLAANIPADQTGIDEGVGSNGVTPGGKPVGDAGYGTLGANNYTQWFAGDPQMAGTYGGYDGPCPPWNDSIIHHYHFTVYALDVATLTLQTGFDGPALLAAMEGHVLASAQHTGTYTLNAALQ